MKPFLLATILLCTADAHADGNSPVLTAAPEVERGQCAARFPNSRRTLQDAQHPPLARSVIAQEERDCRRAGFQHCEAALMISQQAARCIADEWGHAPADAVLSSNARNQVGLTDGLVWIVERDDGSSALHMDASSGDVLGARMHRPPPGAKLRCATGLGQRPTLPSPTGPAD